MRLARSLTIEARRARQQNRALLDMVRFQMNPADI